MTNVIAFVPRQQEAPALMCVELRLGDDCSIEMILRDDANEVVATLEYTLTAKPRDFDLDRLREAWETWRDRSSVAS